LKKIGKQCKKAKRLKLQSHTKNPFGVMLNPREKEIHGKPRYQATNTTIGSFQSSNDPKQQSNLRRGQGILG